MPAASYRQWEQRYQFQKSITMILRPEEATFSSRPPLYKQYLALKIAKIEVFPAARREKRREPKFEVTPNFATLSSRLPLYKQ